MISLRAAAPPALLLAAALAAAGPSRAQEVAAVLSSAPGPYRGALDSFVRAYGREVSTVRLPARLPAAGAGVFVAFGGEAALRSYPADATVIARLAPGLGSRGRHPAPVRFLSM